METSRRLDLSLPLFLKSEIFLAFWIPTMPRVLRVARAAGRERERGLHVPLFANERTEIHPNILILYLRYNIWIFRSHGDVEERSRRADSDAGRIQLAETLDIFDSHSDSRSLCADRFFW